jgi:rubrerythrin
MPTTDAYDTDDTHAYECLTCGERTRATEKPGECPACGGDLRNTSMPRHE